MTTPVNIFTGFLGAGKTTVIMNLLAQLPRPEKVVWLKNEYGDVNIDKLMVEQTHVKVAEILNGCLCCVLVGRLGNALEEIIAEYKPERIIIETSGSAYPAPIVWEVQKIPELSVDSVVTIVDALNFSGYEDKSYAAEVQSKYVDLVVINKYPKVEAGSNAELELEHRLDDIYAVNPKTPKLKTADGKIDYRLLIGMDGAMRYQKEDTMEAKHLSEVEAVSWKQPSESKLKRQELESYFLELQKSGVIRIKGVVNLEGDGWQICNWVYGMGDWREMLNYHGENQLVFMGTNIASQAGAIQQKLDGMVEL